MKNKARRVCVCVCVEGRAETTLRKKNYLYATLLLEEERNGWNLQKKAQLVTLLHSSWGQSQGGPLHFSQREGCGTQRTGRAKAQACNAAAALPHSVTLSVRNLFSWSKNKSLRMKTNSRELVSHISDARVKGLQTRWGFKSLQSEKNPSHSVNLWTRRFSRTGTLSSII